MNESRSNALNPANETEITLGLLNAIQSNRELTQRSAARELGVALGLVNAYLKRCVKKGFVKVTSAPANRYLYYLTPHGFAEKSRLTREYLTQSFNLFREAREEGGELLARAHAAGWRVAVYGANDLTDVAILSAMDLDMRLAGIIDPARAGERIAGYAVVADLAELDGIDAVLITEFEDPQGAFEKLRQQLPRDRILTPRLLSIAETDDRANEEEG